VREVVSKYQLGEGDLRLDLSDSYQCAGGMESKSALCENDTLTLSLSSLTEIFH
jgi:hypothetical protein